MSLGSLTLAIEPWWQLCWLQLFVCRSEVVILRRIVAMCHLKKISLMVVLLGLLSVPCPAQKKQANVCNQATFAAFRRLPKLSYQCPEGFNEWDEPILKVPERIAELSRLAGELESFTDAAWWQARVGDLNACEIHGQAGALDPEESASLTRGDYPIN